MGIFASGPLSLEWGWISLLFFIFIFCIFYIVYFTALDLSKTDVGAVVYFYISSMLKYDVNLLISSNNIIHYDSNDTNGKYFTEIFDHAW